MSCQVKIKMYLGVTPSVRRNIAPLAGSIPIVRFPVLHLTLDTQLEGNL